MASIFITSNSKKYLLLVLFLTSGLAACFKDSDDPPGLAIYNFITNNGNCTGRVDGIYYKGLDLTKSNSIYIDALVTQKGSYDILTTSVNGIQFRATGILSETGRYTFHMVGQGQPLRKETTEIILLSSDQSSCRIEIPVLYYDDTVNLSENTWEFYDNGVYHQGNVISAKLIHEGGSITALVNGSESGNSYAFFLSI